MSRLAWKFKIVLYDKELNPTKIKKYACGGCGKKRVKNSPTPATMHDRHNKLIWKNKAYKEIEQCINQ